MRTIDLTLYGGRCVVRTLKKQLDPVPGKVYTVSFEKPIPLNRITGIVRGDKVESWENHELLSLSITQEKITATVRNKEEVVEVELWEMCTIHPDWETRNVVFTITDLYSDE